MFRKVIRLILLTGTALWGTKRGLSGSFGTSRRSLAISVTERSGALHTKFSVNITAFHWLDNYIRWHNAVRSNPESFEKAKVLIVDDGSTGRIGGGLGDRLKSLPYYLWLASKHERVLLIQWFTKCGIEEFFQPNLFDWRAPPSLYASSVHLNILKDRNDAMHDYLTHLIGDADMEAHKSDRVLRVFGNNPSFFKGLPMVVASSYRNRQIFRLIFHALFRLTDPVQRLLESTVQQIGLGEDYLGVHLRARYPGSSKVLMQTVRNVDLQGIKDVSGVVQQELDRMGSRAVECTRTAARRSGGQVYFASDTLLAMEIQHRKDGNVVYMKTNEERVHFQTHQESCEKYYPAIVDLWLLAQAKCIGFGVGGYGALASIMSGLECLIVHQKQGAELDQDFNGMLIGPDGRSPVCTIPEAV